MKFYKCSECGKIIILENEKKLTNCCGKPMTLITANTQDASLEKHVPSIIKSGKFIKVTIGEIIHPMEENHYIMWIAMVKGNKIEKKDLKPGDLPVATFNYDNDSIIYAYCNLHGLWKKEVE